MPDTPPQRLRRLLEQLRHTREVLCLKKTFDGILNMLNAHRDMPPVENVAHRPLDRAADQVWQCWLAIGNYRNWTLTVPTLRNQSLTELLGRRMRRLLNQTEATANIGTFDLSHHDIKMTPLVFWPTPDVGAVEKDGQRLRCCIFIDGELRRIIGTDDLGDFAQAITHRGIHLFRAGHEGLNDARGFPERMSCSKLSLKALQFRGRSIREVMGKRRKRTALVDIGYSLAGTAANTRRLDMDTTKQRVENPGAIIMDGSDPVAAQADPGHRQVAGHINSRYAGT